MRTSNSKSSLGEGRNTLPDQTHYDPLRRRQTQLSSKNGGGGECSSYPGFVSIQAACEDLSVDPSKEEVLKTGMQKAQTSDLPPGGAVGKGF